MPSRRGLFLDLDGTIADSLPVMRAVYDRFLAEHGTSGSDAGFAAVNGPPLSDVVGILKRTHGLAGEPAALENVYVEFILDAYDRVEPSPGAGSLIDRARGAGWRIAVVTSSREGMARRWLERTGLATSLDAVVTAECVARGKPDPEPYRTALDRTGCHGAGSVAVEDSPNGAASALGAGLKVFALNADPAGAAGVFPRGCHPVGALADVERIVFGD